MMFEYDTIIYDWIVLCIVIEKYYQFLWLYLIL